MKKIMLSILVLILMFLNTGCNSVFSKKAQNCESQIVKELVIDNVKRKDWYYQDIDENSISKVYIKNPAATKYDKDIDKYFCKGQFVVESTDVGFKPKKNYDDNDYYNYVKIYDWFNNGLEVTEIKKIRNIFAKLNIVHNYPKVKLTLNQIIVPMMQHIFLVWENKVFSVAKAKIVNRLDLND